MKNAKILMFAVALMMMALPFAAFCASESSDAVISIEGDAWQDAITPDGGDIHIKLKSTESSGRVVKITVVKSEEPSVVVGSADCTIPSNETYTATVHIKVGGLGEHNITIKCTPTTYFGSINETHMVVKVTQSIWSNWTTYIAIIAAAAIAFIGIFLYMRNKPKIKPDVSFTELEERKARKSEAPAAATERKRYNKSEPKEKIKAAPAKETKKTTFTEMEEERKAKKEAAKAAEPAKEPAKTEPAKEVKKEPVKEAKKEPAADDGQKIKYVSSRRK